MSEARMVTILPFEMDEDLLRDGLSAAVAERLEARLRDLTELVAELRTSGVIQRVQWQQYLARLVETAEQVRPVLEYARCFDDQWPSDDAEDPGNG